MTVTFFGHSNAPTSMKSKLKEVLIELITTRGADRFYVGNNGSFDRMALSALRELKEIYPDIEYRVVLAYLPKIDPDEYVASEVQEEYTHTEYPEGIELVPKKFAICFRNKWMIDRANVVVTYVVRSYGGAVKFAEMARRKGKEVLNIV